MTSESSQGSSQSHYSVTRGANRRDPNYISCLNSDGNPSKWKEPGTVIDNTGMTCYWKTDDSECHVLEEKWKKTLGKTIAKLLHLTDDTSDEDWRIQDFPKDYKLFRHVKGTREDYYLFGSGWVTKFRTANEFSPHFHWLCLYEPTRANRIYCKCKYCSGSKQGSVNSSLGINNDQTKRFASPVLDSKSASQNKRKAEEDMMAKENLRKRLAFDSNSSNKPPRVPSQKPLASRKSLPTHVLNSVSNAGGPGRRSTFSGPYVNKDRDRDLSELKCTFRMAELVWCRLDVPIDGTKEGRPDLRIDYWPAICEERVLVSNSQVLASDSSTDKASSPGSLSLKVQQKFQWKVRLLATSDVYCKDEPELLAYLNYPPPLNIYKLPINSKGLKYIHDGHESDRPTIQSFSSFSEALAPFALSLQITAHIKKSFTLMDRYDIALLKRLEARGQNIPIEDVQILYEDSTLPWYQYIWWGAEKIWSGELIRLIVTASDLPTGLRPITQGDHSRCFFLKVTGFYRSTQEEGMVKGSIFELSPIAQRAKDQAEQNPEFEQPDSFPGVQQINRYMPEAPNGYFFRRLTPVGKEHYLVLQHIAGRYYPPRHPIILDPSNLVQSDSPAPFSTQGRSLILSGLGEGRWLHMHCETWALDRKECFKEAEASAERELIAFCEKPLVDETIKTKSVAVIESEIQNDGTMDVLENGMGFIGSNEDIAMDAESLAAIDHYLTNGRAEGEKDITLDQSNNNDMDVEPNTATPIDPPIVFSSVKAESTVSTGPMEAENDLTLSQSKNDHMNDMRPNNNAISIHAQLANFNQEDKLAVTKKKSDVPLVQTEAETSVNLTASIDRDSNMELTAVSFIDPMIVNSIAKGENAVPPPGQAEVKDAVPVGLTEADLNRIPAVGSANRDVHPEPHPAISLDPHVASLGEKEQDAAPPGHTAVDDHVTLAETKHQATNLEPHTVTPSDPHVTTSSEKEKNSVSPSQTKIADNAIVAESSDVDMNLELDTAAPVDPHIPNPQQKEQNGVSLSPTIVESSSSAAVAESSHVDMHMESHTVASVDPDNVTNLNQEEQNAVPLDRNTEPTTTTPTDPYIANSKETEDTAVPLGHGEVDKSVNVAESSYLDTNIEPNTVTSIDPYVASVSGKEKNDVAAGVTTSTAHPEVSDSHVANGSTEREKSDAPTSPTHVGLVQDANLSVIDPQLSNGSSSAPVKSGATLV